MVELLEQASFTVKNMTSTLLNLSNLDISKLILINSQRDLVYFSVEKMLLLFEMSLNGKEWR